MIRRSRSRALTEALQSCAPDLLRFLSRRVPAEDAADLLGETMMIAWRQVENTPTDDAEARMWLFGIARGTLLNYARGERRRQALASELRDRVARLAVAPAADAGVEVRDALTRIHPDGVEIIRLVHWDGFSLNEVAQLLELPASTVRGRYARAKNDLRAVLELATMPT